MELVLRRDQRQGLLGKVVFSLNVRARLSDEEQENVQRYRLGETEIYSSHEITDRGSGLLGAATRLAWKAAMLTITVNDLAKGKHIEAKDVVELLAIEEQIKEAARNFKAILEAAAQFGGEEVVPV